MKKAVLSLCMILLCLTVLLSACGAPQPEPAPSDAAWSAEGIFRNQADASSGLTLLAVENGQYEVFADIGGVTMPGVATASGEVLTANLTNYLSAEPTVAEIRQDGENLILTVVDPAGAEGVAAGDTYVFIPGLPDYEGMSDVTERFVGIWYDHTSGRASMTILLSETPEQTDDEVRYDVTIRWGSSAWEESVWTMTAGYDKDADALVYTDGSHMDRRYRDNGEIEKEDVAWTDAEGSLRLENGLILWTDSHEEWAEELRFERYRSPDVSPEEFADRYFRAAIVEQGTAGSSLKQATAACAVLTFARDGSFWNCDIPTMRENMLAAWESLSQQERDAFDESFFGGELWQLINSAVEDYDSVRDMFRDAGVDDEMSALLAVEDTILSWQTLLPHTFTMGNSED